MAVIKAGSSAAQLEIEATSKAARVILYDIVGNQLASLPVTISGPVTITDGSGPVTIDGTVAISNFPGMLTDAQLRATPPAMLSAEQRAATLVVTATAAAAAAVTLTIPAAGAGLSHYLTTIEITAYTTVARTGTATPIVVTTTNLPGALAWTFATAGAVGATDIRVPTLTTPLKSSSANTATTIVCPATASVIWRVTAAYFTGA